MPGPIEDRDLLRRAYPLGVLPMFGVVTLGGFACVMADVLSDRSRSHRSIWRFTIGQELWRTATKSGVTWSGYGQQWRGRAKECLAVGDLLPFIDVRVTPTWMCAVADLAEAVRLPGEMFVWSQGGPSSWTLTGVHTDGRTQSHIFYDLTAADAAHALVTARIHARQEFKR